MSPNKLSVTITSNCFGFFNNCISHHATDEIKEKYLPKMVEGKWSGTMCLTVAVC
jgi:alkylation response protein AidB-like acyl-CoA dehydrogenase